MTKDERREVGACYLGIASVYGRDVQPQTLAAILDAVDDLPAHLVLSAIRTWVRVSTFQRPPFPVEIRQDVLGTPPSDQDEANIIANRIIGAVPKFGHPNGKEAREYIGEIGWQVIMERGGWLHHCESANARQETMQFAQLRDAVRARLVKDNYQGESGLQIGAGEIKSQVVGDIVKQLSEKLGKL